MKTLKSSTILGIILKGVKYVKGSIKFQGLTHLDMIRVGEKVV